MGSFFIDDCGAKKETQRYKTFFVKNNDSGNLKRVYMRKGQICKRVRSQGGYAYKHMEEYSDIKKFKLIEFSIYLCKNKLNPHYQRKISWMKNSFPAIAAYEYRGRFPGHTSHGNAKYGFLVLTMSNRHQNFLTWPRNTQVYCLQRKRIPH